MTDSIAIAENIAKTTETRDGESVDTYTAFCPLSNLGTRRGVPCGWSSSGWSNRGAAEARLQYHLDEHTGHSTGLELYAFLNNGERHEDWVDDGPEPLTGPNPRAYADEDEATTAEEAF